MQARILTASLFLTLPSMALAQEWEKLGTRKVDFGADKDTIPCVHEGRFVALKIDVEDGDLEMYNIKVTFGDGTPFSPDTRLQFHEGSRSRTVDLPGEARVIRKVEFWYKSKFRKGRATVHLFAKHAGGGGETPPPTGKWEKLGSRQVDFGADKDTLPCAHEGRFNALKIDVTDGNLEMYNIKVTFGDGTSLSPDTRIEFKQGSTSRTIDLPGDARVVRKVEFWYRSELKRGRATIHLFGRHADGGTPPRKDPKERFEGWEHLGSRTVDFGVDKDVLNLTGEGAFASFRLEVEEGDLVMYDIVVTFGNGEKFSPPTRFEFDQNSRTRDFDLPGKARKIAKIEFFYKSQRGGAPGKAAIHVYGKR